MKRPLDRATPTILVNAERVGYVAAPEPEVGDVLSGKSVMMSEMCGHEVRTESMLAGQLMWTTLVGAISLELLGNVPSVVMEPEELFDRLIVGQCSRTLIR